MTEEWLEVVNEQDEVIDCRPGSEIHHQQLRHRATSAVDLMLPVTCFYKSFQCRKIVSPALGIPLLLVTLIPTKSIQIVFCLKPSLPAVFG